MMLPPSNLPDFSTPTPADLPGAPSAVPSNVPTPLDPTQVAAYNAFKQKAAAMSGYASTITTSGQGVLTPANTTAGVKSFAVG